MLHSRSKKKKKKKKKGYIFLSFKFIDPTVTRERERERASPIRKYENPEIPWQYFGRLKLGNSAGFVVITLTTIARGLQISRSEKCRTTPAGYLFTVRAALAVLSSALARTIGIDN